MITYNAQVKNGKYRDGLDSFDYIGHRVQEVGIDPGRLHDNFNGSLTVLGSTMLASVRRVSEYFFVLLRPQISIGPESIAQAAVIAVLILAVLLLVILAVCFQRTRSSLGGGPGRAGAEGAGTGTGDGLPVRRKSDFEERWPEDCRRWRDRTDGEKYRVSLKGLLILSLLMVFVFAALSGEDSVWYCIYSGEWNNGINLHSITASLISICILFVLKGVIHKALFLLARSLDTKGETVCMLLNSFSGYALVIIGIFVCLGNFGINAKALSLSAGVAGVIFSIGCQSIAADILAGVLMTFEGTVQVGDFLMFDGKPVYVQSIGVRTIRLKFFGEVTVVRNNEFKNYILMPPERENLIQSSLTVDRKESLERIEEILGRELPEIHDRLCAEIRDSIQGPKYTGVSKITESGTELSFTTFCKGRHSVAVRRGVNRELLLMCERNMIAIAIPKVEVKN